MKNSIVVQLFDKPQDEQKQNTSPLVQANNESA